MGIEIEQIRLFSIHFGPIQILDFCFLKQIEMTHKEVILMVKRNETKLIKTNSLTLFDPIQTKNVEYTPSNQNDKKF